ncbi:hypothetical protein [Cupriavidus sp. MP-37]
MSMSPRIPAPHVPADLLAFRLFLLAPSSFHEAIREGREEVEQSRQPLAY